MSVAIIKKIGRRIFRIFSSLYSVIAFIVFISTVSVYITLDITNDKNDNNGKNYEDIWTRYEDDVIKKKVTPTVFIDRKKPNEHFHLHLHGGFILILACCIILALILNFCCSTDCIRGCLEISYNWLFRRNQARENEPAVHYIETTEFIGENEGIYIQEYSSDEAEL